MKVYPNAWGAELRSLGRARWRMRALLSVALVLLGTSPQSRAQTLTWDGRGNNQQAGNWSGGNNQNWTGRSAPATGSSNNFVFTSTARLTNTNNVANLTFLSLVFNSTAGPFVISGNAVTLAGGITNNSSSLQTVNLAMTNNTTQKTVNAASGNITLGGAITGTGGIIKEGVNVLTLSGANNYTGGTTINAGTLSLGAANRLADTGAVTVAGGTFNLGGFTETVGAVSLTSGTITNGTLTGSSYALEAGTIAAVLGGNAALTKTGAGEVALNGANTYTGTTSINGGTLSLGNAGALGGSGSISFGGGTLRYSAVNTADLSSRITGSGGTISIDTAGQNVTFASALAGSNTGGLRKSGNGTLTLSAANSYTGATTIAGGALSIAADNNLGAAPGSPTAGSLTFSNGTLLFTSGFTLNANRGTALGTGGGTFNVASGQSVSYAGAMTGSGNFTKAGTGTLNLSASNSYSGTTTLSAGTLRAANTSALGAAVAGDALTLNGGRFELASDTNATFGPTTGYGTTVGGNVTVAVDRVTSGAATSAQIGTLSIGGQTLTVERGTNATSGTAALIIGGATTLTGNATFTTAANTELLFSNTLAGAFNITKTGAGILTLTRGGGQADNTITAGQLNINHFQALGTSPGTLSLAGGVTIDNTSGAFLRVGNAKSISLGSTLTFLGSSSLDLGAGTTTLTNDTAINVVANTLTLEGDVIGAFGLTKNGIGTLELSGLTGTNSFTGNSFINAGELFLSGTSRFGGTSNTIVTVETNAFLRIGASASLGNVSLVLNNPDGLILANIITNDVVFSNSGTISSTYANVDGSITIGEGVTMSTAANNLGTIPTTNTPGRIVIDDNSTLAFTASFQINQNQGITLQPGVATFSSTATNVQVAIASSIAGDGELRKTGAGNVRLTGSNSYTGGTLIEQGIIGITSDSSLGAVSGRVKLNNGTLVAAQNNTGGPTNTGTTVNAARTLVLGNGTTNNIDAQTGLFFEYNSVIGEENVAGAASAMRFGIAGTREGTVKLGGLNTWDGASTIVAGTLEISNIANGGQASGIGQSGNAATNLVIGGTLRYAGTNGTTDRLFSIGASGAAAIDSGSGSLAFTNTGSLGYAATDLIRHDLNLTGTGSGTMALALINDIHGDPLHLTKSGSGTWTLLGANTYSGETVISAGTLQVGNGGTAGALGSGNVINNGSLVFDRSDNISNEAIISGTGSVVKRGGGTLTLGGENSFSGGLSILGGAVSVAQEGFLGASSNAITLDNGKLVTTATVDLGPGRSFTFGAGGGTIEVAGGTTATVDGLFGGTGNFTKIGAGTLALDAASSGFEGASFINQGTLRLNDENVLASSAVTVASGATLAVAFGNASIGNLGGAGNVTVSSNAIVGGLDASAVLSGNISGNGSLTKNGAGTLTLSGTNTHAGGLFLNGNGAVRAQSAAAFGSGGVTQSGGSSKLIIDTTGTITNQMDIYNVSILQSVTLTGAKTLRNATYDVTNNTTTTETGFLSGEGGVTKEGSGTLVIAGTVSNTFTGATVVNAGALVLSNSAGGALSGSNITVNGGASLILAASDQIGDSIGLILNGGTFITGDSTTGYSEQLGTLTLNANSTIDLGAATNFRVLQFANSSGITWATNAVLTITNWQGLNRQSSDVTEILFGTGGLTSTQLGQIRFANQDINGGLLIGDNGELTPIPEAEVYWAALAIVLAVVYRERRRVALLWRRLSSGPLSKTGWRAVGASRPYHGDSLFAVGTAGPSRPHADRRNMAVHCD